MFRSRSVLPPDVRNNKLWLDGADADSVHFSSGVLVDQWGDKSGNSNDSFLITPSYEPTYVEGALNNKNVLRFAFNAFLAGGALGISGAEAVTIIIVAIPQNNTVFKHGKTNRNARTQREIELDTTLDASQVQFNGGFRKYSGTLISETPYIITHTSENLATIEEQERYVNGVLSTEASVANPTLLPALIDESYYVGCTIDNAGNPIGLYIGDIGEIMVYNRYLTTSERTSLEAYASKKWAIVLP